MSTSDDIPYPDWYPIKSNFDDHYDSENGPAVLCSFMKKDSEWKKKAEEIELNKFIDPKYSIIDPKDFRMPNIGR